MTPEQIWRGRPDAELVEAAGRLDDYYEEGQWAVLHELARRGLRMPNGEAPVVPDRPSTAEAAPAAPTAALRDEGQPAPPLEAQPALVRPPFWPPSVALRALWRGDYSLAVTYWGFSQLGGLLLAIPQLGLRAQGHTVAADLVDGIAVAYSAVVIVGIWRSAARYRGKRIWADLARAATVLPIVFALVALATQS